MTACLIWVGYSRKQARNSNPDAQNTEQVFRVIGLSGPRRVSIPDHPREGVVGPT